MRLIGKPVNITLPQVCAPNYMLEMKSEAHANIQGEFDHTSKQSMLIIIGDWNAKVGNEGSEMKQKIGLWISVNPATCPLQTHGSDS